MGVITTTQEVTYSVPSSRLFMALFLDAHNFIPKLIPQIKSIELLHGDGGVGTIKQTIFAEGSEFKYMKHRIDSIDIEKKECNYSLIEGDVLGDHVESINYEVKFEPSGSGCVCKTTAHYHIKAGVEVKEEDIKKGEEKAMGMLKVFEDHLVANPDIYA